MLDLSSDQMLLEIHAPGQKDPVGLYYRTPTVPEIQRYKSATVKVKDGKVKYKLDDVRLKMQFGAIVLTGIREGDFGVKGEPISSDQNSKHYAPQWKQLIYEKFPQLIVALATVVFDGVRATGDVAPDIFTIDDTEAEDAEAGNGAAPAEQEAAEDARPLLTSSGG